ncbi:hypothetical protein PPS11_28503 [Pseudomonas putida S11]|nr:hypothetical protein PPS11_28503 [Pseudomonas putida S11]
MSVGEVQVLQPRHVAHIRGVLQRVKVQVQLLRMDHVLEARGEVFIERDAIVPQFQDIQRPTAEEPQCRFIQCQLVALQVKPAQVRHRCQHSLCGG